MGAIRDAIKSFDGNDEAKKELENQLDNMTALAKAKADYFELALKDDLANAGSDSSKDIPVKFIIDFTRQTHAYASSSAESIADTITEAIDNFISGGQENVMKGVGALMTKTVQTLFASKDGGEDESHFISVFAEGRALVRLDLKAWKRFTNVKSLIDKIYKKFEANQKSESNMLLSSSPNMLGSSGYPVTTRTPYPAPSQSELKNALLAIKNAEKKLL